MKFIIMWNGGYGDEVDIVECDSLEEAEELAAHEWRETVESNASYSAVEATQEALEEEGLDDE